MKNNFIFDKKKIKKMQQLLYFNLKIRIIGIGTYVRNAYIRIPNLCIMSNGVKMNLYNMLNILYL